MGKTMQSWSQAAGNTTAGSAPSTAASQRALATTRRMWSISWAGSGIGVGTVAEESSDGACLPIERAANCSKRGSQSLKFMNRVFDLYHEARGFHYLGWFYGELMTFVGGFPEGR